MIAIDKNSCLDQGISQETVARILKDIGDPSADKSGSRIVLSRKLPDGQMVPCRLYGPAVGDPPVQEGEVVHNRQEGREYISRLIAKPARQSDTLTLVAGPRDGNPLVLFTAFGGPATPPEPGDPECKDVAASTKFWAEHALAQS